MKLNKKFLLMLVITLISLNFLQFFLILYFFGGRINKLENEMEYLRVKVEKKRVNNKMICLEEGMASLKRKINILKTESLNTNLTKIIEEEKGILEEWREESLSGHGLAIISSKEVVKIDDENFLAVLYNLEGREKLEFNPETVTWFTLGCYQDYLDRHRKEYLTFFFEGLDWLKNYQVLRWEAYDLGGENHIVFNLPRYWWSEPYILQNRTVRTLFLDEGREGGVYLKLRRNRSYEIKIYFLDEGNGEYEVETLTNRGFGSLGFFRCNSTNQWVTVSFKLPSYFLKWSMEGEYINQFIILKSITGNELTIDKVEALTKDYKTVLDVGKRGLSFTCLEYYFRFPYAGLNPPWISGMAQGLYLEVLAHAYKLTKYEQLLEIGDSVLNSFYVKSENGGVRETDRNHEWWFAEYPGSKNYVLNGFLTSLEGLYIYYNETGNMKAYDLFLKGFNEAKKHLKEYDSNNTTLYDAKGNVAKPHYHQYHVKLLKELYDFTGDAVIKRYYLKWSKYLFAQK